MRRRSRWSSSPPVPPPVRAIVVDGSNVIASGSARARERLQLALAWCTAWRADLGVELFVDHATADRCGGELQDWLRAQARPAGAAAGAVPRVVLCPPAVAADGPLLRRAAELQALVLSNDRFFDHAALRAGVLTLQFALARGEFAPADHATWFRARGPAVRVPLAVLRDGLRRG
jgi:hypothetical protein